MPDAWQFPTKPLKYYIVLGIANVVWIFPDSIRGFSTYIFKLIPSIFLFSSRNPWMELPLQQLVQETGYESR